jgi:hypothetical protein
MSSTQSINQSVIEQLTAMEAACAAIRKTLGLAELSVATPATKARKSKAKAERSDSEAEGEPKEKKPPSAWIVFSVRVQKQLRVVEEGLDKAEKTKVGTMNQFAGHLWGQKKEWADEEITAAWDDYTPPEVSKQTLEGKSKRSGASSTGSGEAGEPVADEVKEKKPRKPQSEETKAAAALKRAATKAAKAAKPEAPEASEAEAEAEAVEAPPAAPPAAPKAKAKITPKPKKVDLALDPWSHDGEEYYKNERGDVLSADGEWVGRWTGSAIDTTVPEPEDFDKLESRA